MTIKVDHKRWSVHSFGSGTHIVRRPARRPHFYVYAAPGLSRIETCEQLCAWLNNEGPRPAWADDMIRDTPTCARHPALNESGVMLPIYATGPMRESEPGCGDWESEDEFESERVAMIDMLLGKVQP